MVDAPRVGPRGRIGIDALGDEARVPGVDFFGDEGNDDALRLDPAARTHGAHADERVRARAIDPAGALIDGEGKAKNLRIESAGSLQVGGEDPGYLIRDLRRHGRLPSFSSAARIKGGRHILGTTPLQPGTPVL